MLSTLGACTLSARRVSVRLLGGIVRAVMMQFQLLPYHSSGRLSERLAVAGHSIGPCHACGFGGWLFLGRGFLWRFPFGLLLRSFGLRLLFLFLILAEFAFHFVLHIIPALWRSSFCYAC